MASRESTGLQIGLILSVIVNVGLGVTAFIFQKDIQEAQIKVKSADTAKDEANKAKEAADLTAATMKVIVSTDDKADSKKLEETFQEDLKTFGDPRMMAKDAAAAKPVYHDILVGMQTKINSLNDQVIKANADKVVQVDGKQTVVVAKTNEAAKAEADKNTTMQAGGVIKASFDNELVAIRAGAVENAKKYEAGIANLAKDKDKLNATISELQARLAKTEKEYAALKNEKNIISTPNFEWTQGKVTYINQLENTCYINLGRDDLLRKGISFSVYAPHVTNLKSATPKGSIEVIDITESHVALARLVKSELSDPILPGDEIYTPAWMPGQQQHFAINGFIDIDGDGLSDRKKIHDLVTLNGGIVDAELDEKGIVTGNVTVGTRYVIEGERPTEKSNDEARAGFSKIHGEAERLKVEVISVQKFLKLVGYVPRAISAGGSGTAARKAPPKADPKDKDKDSAFKKREPGAAAPADADK